MLLPDGLFSSFLHFYGVSVARILLWEDKKQTLAAVFLLTALYYFFYATEYTFLKAVGKIFSMIAFFLFVYSKLPEKVYVLSSFFSHPFFCWIYKIRPL